MGLVTCCPKCGSEYEVSADQLKLHDGLVRCGHCSHVFDGFACLKDALPTLTQKVANTPEPSVTGAPVLKTPAVEFASEPSAPTLRPQQVQEGPFVPSVDRQPPVTFSTTSGRREPALGAALEMPSSSESNEPSFASFKRSEPDDQFREPTLGALPSASAQVHAHRTEPSGPARLVGESRVKGDDPSAFGRRVPEFLEDEEEVSEGVSVVRLLGAIILALVLIIQSLVVFRNDIVAAVPGVRPMLVQLCKPFSCDVSYVRQIKEIFVVGSSLQQAPDTQTTGDQRGYILRLTLQNRASYPQPWPALMLTLTDASGTAVIKKALLPSSFLPPNLLEGPMTPRQEASLEIPLLVEGLSISGFEVERFFP